MLQVDYCRTVQLQYSYSTSSSAVQYVQLQFSHSTVRVQYI